MRILITTDDLNERGGVQLFVRDLALKLLERHHEPVAYSPLLGAVAQELRKWTVSVTRDLSTVSLPPDVILGHGHIGTMAALLRFRGCPAIFFCHGATTRAPRFPRIRRYVAVDDTTRAALVSAQGIDPEQIEVILNAVDLARFTPRAPLPPRPRRAALFGNQFEDNAHLRAIREVCRELDIELEIIGRGQGSVAEAPEKVLPRYDVVFARARCALEAMATGAAVILTGQTRMAGMVTTADLDRYRPWNFGRRTLMTPIDADAVRRELARYDASDAAEVSRRIRTTASLDLAIDQILRLCEEVLDDDATIDVDAEFRAASEYLAQLQLPDDATTVQKVRHRLQRWPVIGKMLVRMFDRTAKRLAR